MKLIFEDLILRLGHSQTIASEKWTKISNAYNSPSRFYHNINHLKSMYSELEKVKGEIHDWDSILFSLFYHDYEYNSFKTDNEEVSAEIASIELTTLNISPELIEKIKKTIVATKSHTAHENHDINIFLDTDLSILGAHKDVYDNYSKNIRLEYIQYPSFVFNQGRMEVLEYFLSRKSIFKTNFFKNKLEKKAVDNLHRELTELKRMKHTFSRTETNEFVQYLEFDGNLSEFFYTSAKILDCTEGVEKIKYYPGWFDSGYYKFNFRGTLLHLEYNGMLGTLLRTAPNSNQVDKLNADEIFQKLIGVRLSNEDLAQVRKFYNDQNTTNNK